MSGWREEIIILKCGCKIGRSGKGPCFYDFICEEHLIEVLDAEGHYDYDKALAFTDKLNKDMRQKEKMENEQHKDNEQT